MLRDQTRDRQVKHGAELKASRPLPLRGRRGRRVVGLHGEFVDEERVIGTGTH